MKLISWNVNGLRACITKGFYDFVSAEQPDILALQETKMQPIDFPQSNVIFKKPPDMTDEECGSAPAAMVDGHIILCWEMSDEELEQLKSSKKIFLGFFSNTLCPHYLTVNSPFKEDSKDGNKGNS